MNDAAKITLSPDELLLVTNSEWILTKHTIIQKVYRMFGELSEMIRLQEGQEMLPPNILANPPKIARGENYRLLPYVMLDYPRYFGKPDVFAVRYFFWWGNFFSVTLHLAGGYAGQFREKINEGYEVLKNGGWWICNNTDPWQHGFEEGNYVRIDQLSAVQFADMLERESFLKIANKISLSGWDEVPDFLLESVRSLYNVLGMGG